jgi:DNA mismatch repair protein MutL
MGQLDRTYLVCEGDGELVLIDQHAAHERVAFQRLRDRADTDAVATQRLLFPTTLELPPGEAAVVADGGPLLGAVGFDVEPFGASAVAIKAVPAGLRHDPTQVLRELLGDLADRGGSRAVDERLDRVLATIACHSVVRAGDVLGADEARALLGQMDGVDFRAHCPHGRPVLLRIGVPEIARRFGRT